MLYLNCSNKDMQKYAVEGVTPRLTASCNAVLRPNTGRDLIVYRVIASSQNRFRVCLTEEAGIQKGKETLHPKLHAE
jgi:hypothetical protein